MAAKKAKALKPVIVRTYSAGVHFGYLVKREGKEVTLERSRRLWRWFGAWTLSEIATSGVDVSKSKIGAPVTVVVTEAIEVIDCTPAAVASLESDQMVVVTMPSGCGFGSGCGCGFGDGDGFGDGRGFGDGSGDGGGRGDGRGFGFGFGDGGGFGFGFGSGFGSGFGFGFGDGDGDGRGFGDGSGDG